MQLRKGDVVEVITGEERAAVVRFSESNGIKKVTVIGRLLKGSIWQSDTSGPGDLINQVELLTCPTQLMFPIWFLSVPNAVRRRR